MPWARRSSEPAKQMVPAPDHEDHVPVGQFLHNLLVLSAVRAKNSANAGAAGSLPRFSCGVVGDLKNSPSYLKT